MPSTQVELDDGDKALDGVIDRGHGEEGFGVCHEAVFRGQLLCPSSREIRSGCVLGDPLEHGAGLEDEGG